MYPYTATTNYLVASKIQEYSNPISQNTNYIIKNINKIIL